MSGQFSGPSRPGVLLQLVNEDEMPSAPGTSRSQFLDSIYHVDQQITRAGRFYFFKSLGRKLERLVSDENAGMVRYKGHWWRLRPHSTFQQFVIAAKLEGIEIKVDKNPYDPKKHEARPYFLAWEIVGMTIYDEILFFWQERKRPFSVALRFRTIAADS